MTSDATAARPLRILILGPVNQVHVEHMALGVRERGHEVIVGGEVWPGAPDSRLAAHGIPVSVRTWPTARWMRRLLRQTTPDVVHAHWMPIAALALLYGASPLVVSAWGSDLFHATERERRAYRRVARHADVLMGSSRALVGELHDLGAPEERTVVLNWGVDLRSFSPGPDDRAVLRRALGLPDGPMILGPRWLRDVYNPTVIVRAFDRVADERDDVALVLNHIGSEPPDLGTLRHADRVRIVGHVAPERMADLYRAADVCVSIASSDSSPRSVWEAMACGTPCVLSDIPWVHELIRHEEHALVTPIDDNAVAGAIRRLLDDAALGARIRRDARRLVVEHRDRERELDRLCAVYERVVRDGGRHVRLRQAMGTAAAAGGIAQAFVRRGLAGTDEGRPPGGR